MMKWISKNPPQHAHPRDTWLCEKDGMEYGYGLSGWSNNQNYIPHPKKFKQLINGDYPSEEARKED